ncbi:MAG: hypothetical protein JWO91_97 [Acidobacteriaceae bacterium]|nr:hypothetical protein [Acidobacteriaceae bacterium]
MRASCLLCLFLSIPLWSRSHPKPSPETLVLNNVNVIDTRDGTVQPHRTVVIQQDTIVAVAKFAIVESSPHTRVINGNGKYLIPGLWDMHVHSTGNSAKDWDERTIYSLYIANGVTGIRDMGGDTDLLEQRRDRIELGEFAGPHIVFNNSSVAENRRDWQTVAVSAPALSEGSDAEPKSIEQLAGIMLACSSKEDELRQEGQRALGSHDDKAYASLAAQTRATYDSQKGRNLFLRLADRGTRMVPTLVWSQTSVNLASPRTENDAALKYVPAAVRGSWESQRLHGTASVQSEEAQKVAARDIELVGAMHRAGVQFMAGTESPAPYVVPGFSLHQELQWLVKSGFTPAQALQAATIDPAIFMVKLDKYGVVERDHIADLVLLNANPLEDISNTQKIAAVIQGGKYYSREDLDQLLENSKD